MAVTSLKSGSGSSGLVELASGVDALYCSGRGLLPADVIGRLELGRDEAEVTGESAPVEFGGVLFELMPHSLGRYRYRLDHPNGVLGVTQSDTLPTVKIQPRAAFIHAVGALACIQWFRSSLDREILNLELTASRIDLHVDVQGWQLDGDDRTRFLTRATNRVTYEDSEAFSGFLFGKRKSKTYMARIYDKTLEMRHSRAEYLKDLWGSSYDPERQVLRVEFEIGRQGLADFGLREPEDVIEASGALWQYCTGEWLTYRSPTGDQTRSRWPVSPEWQRIQRSAVADSGIGLPLVRAGIRRGEGKRIVAHLTGYMVSYAAYFDLEGIEETFNALQPVVRSQCTSRELSFEKRVLKRRRQIGLP